MLSLRRAVLVAVSAASLLGLAWGCSASNDAGPSGHPGGGSPGMGDSGNEAQVLSPDGSGDAGEGSLGLNPLCGVKARQHCVPDEADACASYVAPASDGDASIDAAVAATPDSSTSSQAGESGEGGVGGESSVGAAGVGGASGAGPSAAGAGGASGAPGGPLPQFSCQVQRVSSDAKSVASQCAVVGSGGVNSPCLTSSDCGFDAKHGGALGCVGDAKSGLCEPYCCQGDNTCAEGSFCAERPLRDALTNASTGSSSAPVVMIPVCVPAQNCDLSTPYPCPSGTACACAASTACVVVRADGTTTCAVPGAGKPGEACPCAWGNVCSVATNQCLKLCYTRGSETCGDGTCQASAELPDGWGVCVGASPASGG